MKRVYLDVCCLCRPFDDQSQHRIRQEIEAVSAIYRRVEEGEALLVASSVVLYEVSRIADQERSDKIRSLVESLSVVIELGEEEVARANELVSLGFSALDARHVACAEAGKVEVFLTTDDRLVRTAARSNVSLALRVLNPVDWLNELDGT